MPWTLPYVRKYGLRLPFKFIKEGLRGRAELRQVRRRTGIDGR